MGKQQPVGIAPPHGDFLAMVEHRHLHPVERARGQHLLRHQPRGEQRRIFRSEVKRFLAKRDEACKVPDKKNEKKGG